MVAEIFGFCYDRFLCQSWPPNEVSLPRDLDGFRCLQQRSYWMSRFRLSLAIAALIAASTTSLSAAELRTPCDDPVPGEYIVVLKAGSFRGQGASLEHGPALEELAQSLSALHGGRPRFYYRNDGAPGFSVALDSSGAWRLTRDPRVELVEQ